MKKTNLFKVGILSLTALMIFAGCGAKVDKEAQEAVKTAIANSYKVKSGNYVVSADGKLSTTDPGAGFKELEGSLDLSGVYDASQAKDPKFTFILGAKGSVDGSEEQSLTGELRVANKNFYFNVGNLDKLAALGPYADLVAPFLNKWWFVEMPAEAIESFGVYGDDETNLTPTQKAMKKLNDETMFFTNVKNEGDDKVDAVEAVKYLVELDKEALKKYIVESGKISGEVLDEDDVKEMNEIVDLVNFKGNVWSSKKDNVAVKIDGTVTLTASEKTDNTGFSFNVSYTISNVNGAVTVEVPADAEKFDPFATMGAAGGAGEIDEATGL